MVKPMNPCVVLTRPAGRNENLVNLLQKQAQNLQVLTLPALGLAPLVPSDNVVLNPQHYDTLVFVSRYAASLYLNLLHKRNIKEWPDRTIAASVGASSAKPLYESGFIPSGLIVHPALNNPNQDSEALWSLLRNVEMPIKKALILRGQTGREWLGQTMEAAGIQVNRVALYERKTIYWDRQQLSTLSAMLNRQPESVIFLLTSSDSVQAVFENIRQAGLVNQWSKCKFISIHGRISDRLHKLLQGSPSSSNLNITLCPPTDSAIYKAINILYMCIQGHVGLQSSHD